MASTRHFIASRKILLQRDGKYTLNPGLIEIAGKQIVDVTVTSAADYEDKVQTIAGLGCVKVYRYDDAMVTPAFINSHTHVAMSFFRGLPHILKDRKNIVEDAFFKVESKLGADDVRAFARMGAYECLLNGVGFIWDHYYHGVAVAEALLDVGIAGVVAPTLQDLAGPGVSLQDTLFNETLEIDAAKRFSEAGIFAAFGPHATDTVSTELWQRILDEASARSLPIHAHLGQSTDEHKRAFERHGVSPAAYLARLGIFDNVAHGVWAHGIYVSDEDFKLINKQKNTFVFCPYSQLIFQFPADVRRWERAGITWVVATDCVASNDSMNVQKELRFASGVPTNALTQSDAYAKFGLGKGNAQSVEDARGQSDEAVHHFASSSVLLPKVFETAGSTHPKTLAGRVEKGALANLVIWKLSHPSFWPGLEPLSTLCRGDTTGAIENMIVAGKFVGSDGNFHQSIIDSVDYLDARREAERRLELLIDRI